MKKKIILCFSTILVLILLMFPLSVSAATPFKLTIVSSQRGDLDPGHAFLVLTNNSSSSVTVGPYILRKGQQVSLGMRDGFRGHLATVGGAYYNVEAAFPGNYNDFTYKTISISSAQVSTIANYFRLNSYYNSLGDVMFHNCTTFSIRAWNKVAPVKYQFEENAIDLPADLKEAIRKLPGSQSGTNLVGTVLKEKRNTNSVYYIDKDSNIVPYKVVSTKFMKLDVLNCNRIKLTWQQASDKNINGQNMVTGYTIVYKGPNGKEKTININSKETTQYTIKNLAANTSYEFIMAPVFKKYGYNLTGKSTSIATRTTENCKVSLNKTSATIDMGKSKTLTLKAVSTGSHPDTLKKVTWKSGNTSIATVSSTGVVTGKSSGTVTIKATIHGKSATCKVKVIKPTLKLNHSTATIEAGKTLKLKATVTGASQKVTWSTSNSKIATVTSEGVVKGLKKGTVTIKVKANGLTKTCKVTVLKKSQRLDLAPYVGKNISYLRKATGRSDLTLDPTNWATPRDYWSGRAFVQQYDENGKETSYAWSLAHFQFGSKKNSQVINCMEINAHFTTDYSIHGVYIRMPMSTAESLLKTKGWRRLTDTQRKAYGIADMRYHHTYGYADQRYYVKNGYMIYISDNGNWDYRDPHKVHCVIYGKTNVMTGEYMQKTGLDAGYIEIVD